jgi:alkylation response protein AidB-like acyl-CoA dehydrogenase
VRDGSSHYVLSGTKVFISGAGTSELYMVMARTGRQEEKGAGVSCFLVPRDAPGLSFGANEHKMGYCFSLSFCHLKFFFPPPCWLSLCRRWRCQPTRTVTFDDVRVPVTQRLGPEGAGFKVAMAGLDGGRLSIAACSLGAAQACFEIAHAYAQERRLFGQNLSSFQASHFKFADMAGRLGYTLSFMNHGFLLGKIIACRSQLRSAAGLLQENHPAASVHAALAKKNVTDQCDK